MAIALPSHPQRPHRESTAFTQQPQRTPCCLNSVLQHPNFNDAFSMLSFRSYRSELLILKSSRVQSCESSLLLLLVQNRDHMLISHLCNQVLDFTLESLVFFQFQSLNDLRLRLVVFHHFGGIAIKLDLPHQQIT
ncbi:hypothetical protein FGO68_gene15153 [Halteria grandinella]|uniref:Uncharacterized protein n=1 Tax=Halteria grandinella TaxID=5974 RepID=A0A8J8NJ63_HALGN|nr:hypothetical protein FGO68_gene15153 [Halteria grandinella]